MSLIAIRAKLVDLLDDVDAEIAATKAIVPPAAQPPAPAFDAAAFFDHVRASKIFGTKLTADQVKGMEAIIRACSGLHLSWTAYILATAFHETRAKMVPNTEDLTYTTAARIREVWPSRFPTLASALPFVRNPKALANKVYNGRMGNRLNTDDGWNYRGRAWPHITGHENYAKADAALRLNGKLLAEPDLALDWDNSALLTVRGMVEGWFTTKTLKHYLPTPAKRGHFVPARQIINGLDAAEKVADAALVFQGGLQAGGFQ